MVEPHRRRGAAKQVIVRCEQSPDSAGIGLARPAIAPWDAKLCVRDALADKHPDKIMVRYHQKFRGIGESPVFRKPTRIAMAVRADDWQLFNRVEQGACNIPHARLDGKKSVWICQTHMVLRCARTIHQTATENRPTPC